MSGFTASPSPPAPLAAAVLLVFLPFSGGFFLSELLRSVNAVIAPNLIVDIGLSPAALGFLTAAFFIPFALFQIPLGLLLDRFGARRVQTVLLLFTALGCIIFSLAESFEALVVARGLIGFGLAGGLMGALKALAVWFPRQRLTLVNGCFFTAGGIGALAATSPMQWLAAEVGWRGAFQTMGAGAVLVAALVLFVVPERGSPTLPPTRSQLVRGVLAIYRDPLFWRVAPLAAGGQGTYMAIQGLWAGPWLRDVAGLDAEGVGRRLFVLAVFMTVGYFSYGLLAQFVRRFGVGPHWTMGAAIFAFIGLQVSLILGFDAAGYWRWIAIGLVGNGAMLAYAYLTESFPADYAGRVNTCVNLVVFSWAFAAQYLAGVIIEAFPQAADGSYPLEGYRWAFAALVSAQLVAFAWYCVPVRRRLPAI